MSLPTLARLRRLETELAKRELAEAMREEAHAQAALEAVQAAMAREQAGAPADPADPLAGAFAAWLPVARRELARDTAALEARARARAACSAAALARQNACRAVDSLIAAEAAASRLRRERRAQLALDDLAAGRRR
jgi:hypothetical protein